VEEPTHASAPRPRAAPRLGADALEATIDEYHGHVASIREQLAREAEAHEAALAERDAELDAQAAALRRLGGGVDASAAVEQPAAGASGQAPPPGALRAAMTHFDCEHSGSRASAASVDEQLVAQLARVADIVERQRGWTSGGT
jgi:hypothetical protein